MSKKVNKKAIQAPDFLCEAIDYNSAFSRGVRVVLGTVTILIISGTASIDSKGRTVHKGDFIGQAKRTFDNITALLKAGNAGWRDVVQTRCYLKSMRYYKKFNVFRTKFYKAQKLSFFPASVCVQAQLCRPELLIETEAVAIINNSKIKKSA